MPTTVAVSKIYDPKKIKVGVVVVSMRGNQLTVKDIKTHVGAFYAISAKGKTYTFDIGTGTCVDVGENWALAGTLDDYTKAVHAAQNQKASTGQIDCQGKHDFRPSNREPGKSKWCARCDHRE